MTGRATVLVVDDEPANRKLLGDLVRLEGYEPLLAASGAEALDVIGRGAIDVVLLDVMMPGMSGLEVLERLAESGVTPGLPVVVISALSDRQTRIAALERGAVDFLNKPFDRHEMAARLRTLVRMKQLQTELAAREEKLREVNDNLERLVLERTNELLASEATLNRAQEVARIGSAHVDLTTRRRHWSAEAYRIWGIAQGTPISADVVMPRIHPDDRQFAQDIWARGKRGEAYTGEWRIVVEGSVRWLRATAGTDTDADGKPLRTVGVFEDITERKEAQTKLEEAALELEIATQRLQRAQEVARVGSIHVDIATGRREWSREAYRIFGIPYGTPISTDVIIARIHLEDRALAARIWESGARGEPYEAECRILRDGKVRWLLGSSEVDVDADGRPVRLVGTFEDVTERKLAELALEESLRFAQASLDALAANIAVLDGDGRVVATNRAWREFAERNGLEADKVGAGADYLGTCDRAAAEGDETAARASALIRDAIGGRIEGSFTYPCHSSTEQRWFLCRATRFAGDGPVRVALAHENLTALVESQLHAEKSARRLDLLAENLPLVLWEGEERGPGPISTRWASDNFERILGVRSAELAGTQAWVQHIHPDDLPNLRRATAPGVWIEQYRWSKPDGTVVHLLSGRTATAGADGSLSTLGFALDITDQKQLETTVRQSLLEKELLLKEIHHRVKNNLQIISSLLAMQSDATPDPGTKEALQEGVHRVRSMALIHERLYQSSTLARIDFGEYAQALSAFLFRSYKAAGPVRLVVDVAPTDLNIETAVPCGLILNELVANALKHAFKDGRGGELRVTVKPDAEGGVRLTVQDTGPGLPPGFRIDQAKSLGLQLVTSLTKQIKGTLIVSNEGGASFSIAFKELTYAAR